VGGADNPVYIPPIFNHLGVMIMSNAPFTRPKVPEGKTEYVTTTQKEITPGQFFVGYETTWKSFQKEAPYSTPKKP
jgi:hypothetical protein